MKIILQVLFGFTLGVAGIMASLYTGLLVNGQPDLRTVILALLLLGITQWISLVAFRLHVVLEVLVGVLLCGIVAGLNVLWSHSFFWEVRYPDGSNPITWRSCVILTTLLAVTEGASFFIFRQFRDGTKKLPKSGDIAHNTQA